MSSEIAIDPAILEPPPPPPPTTTLPIANTTRTATQATQDQGDSDSEWEYDWDDAEVFYLTLDLTIPTPLFPHVAPIATESTTPAKTTNDGKGGAKGTAKSAIPTNKTASGAGSTVAKNPPNIPTTTLNAPASTRAQAFQIQGMATKNPLVSYQNRIYSCEWTENLGSEIFLDEEGKVVGVGRERIHGNPSIVTAKGRTVDFRGMRTAPVVPSVPGQLGASKDATGVKTDFWRRLEEVKMKRGEIQTPAAVATETAEPVAMNVDEAAVHRAGSGEAEGEKGRGRKMLEMEADSEEDEDEDEDDMDVDDGEAEAEAGEEAGGDDTVMTDNTEPQNIHNP
ncbi:hypothetical protein DFH27DRAFT_546473 [Peziza echinospora]|nr:hypothetical protein DFH27DRAFT_546473 [Peziza echinospora]